MIKKYQSGFAQIILILVLMAFAIGGAYYFGTLKNKTNLPQIYPSPTFSATVLATTNPTANWKTYTIKPLGLEFKYPSNLEVTPVTNDSTSLKTDQEYFIGIPGSDILYLNIFLYKTTKSPLDWWSVEGKNKFEELRKAVESAMLPKPTINFGYDLTASKLGSSESLNVVVNSDYNSPQTPSKRFLTIIQQNGYIILTSYQDMGTTESSTEISNQILSTFQFTK